MNPLSRRATPVGHEALSASREKLGRRSCGDRFDVKLWRLAARAVPVFALYNMIMKHGCWGLDVILSVKMSLS